MSHSNMGISWFLPLFLYFHYMLDEGVHLTLHVFLVWLFPLIPPPPPSLHHPRGKGWPHAPPLKMTLHPPQCTFTLLKWFVYVCMCSCVRVCGHEHSSSKSSALLCAELMIILCSAPVLHKPLEPLFTFYLQNNARLTEPHLT